jgi:hypothetical protein
MTNYADDNAELLRRQLDEEERRAGQYEWGVCIDCGIGLDCESDFLTDNRDAYGCSNTCNVCFERLYGRLAFIKAVFWVLLGLERPQHTRVNCC